jgi:hypothetical protein
LRQAPLAALALFLSQAYNMKAVADYELGPGAGVPLERASDAIERAAEFIEQVAGTAGGLAVKRCTLQLHVQRTRTSILG